jgi:hypothetical protein
LGDDDDGDDDDDNDELAAASQPPMQQRWGQGWARQGEEQASRHRVTASSAAQLPQR